MKITYYLEVVSSWCYWAEPAWAELKARYAGRADVEFDWKIALMDASGYPVSRAQGDWFYRRSGTHMRSPFQLSTAWYDSTLKEYLAPNLVAEAARALGVTDDRVRLALSHAALRDGRPVGQWPEALAVAAEASRLDSDTLLARARAPEIEARARATTQEFHGFGVTQRPTFVLENSGGDRAILSGLATAAPLVATAEALLADEAFLRAYTAHHGGPPAA